MSYPTMMEEQVPEENHVLVVTGGVTDTLKRKHERVDKRARDDYAGVMGPKINGKNNGR